MSKRVLITGGFGNLGCWITREFLDAGWEVTVATSTNRSPTLLSKAAVLAMNLADHVSVKKALEGRAFDAVVHAGSLNDGFVEGYFWKCYRVNVEGTSSLLNYLCKDELKHFIYMSTFHVYGASSGTIDESVHPAPKNDYATSHYAAERVVEQHAIAGVPATVLRLTNGYGRPLVSGSVKWHLVFNDLVRMAAGQKKIVLKSDPAQRRDFVWMGDAARAIRQLADSESRQGLSLMNLGFGSSISLGELASEIRAAFADVHGQEIPLEVPPPAAIHQEELKVDSTKLWRMLGWQPSMRLREEAVAALLQLSAEAGQR